jgi:hypothetical protein
MRLQSDLFRSLRAPDDEPAGGFYTRVMNRIETQQRPSVWSLFGESVFAKRLVFASGTFLVLLASVLATSTEPQEPLAMATPEYIFAGQAVPTPVSMEDPQRDRDVVLVNLATYQESD